MMKLSHTHDSPLALAERVAGALAQTAVARDQRGGTPKHERALLRESGLLTLAIPRELGGWGASWPEIFAVVRKLAQVDGSVAHVFGFQHLLLATLRLFADEKQWRPWFAETVEKRWFWGNALNPLDPRTTLTWQGDLGTIQGDKSFCSGALDSDMLVVSAIDQTTQKLAIGAVPTQRSGIQLFEDWDNIGQRQTDSGSAHFEAVEIRRHELLTSPGPLGSTFASLRPCIAQLVLANIYVGIAQGAFAAAREYTSQQTKAWFTSGVERPSQDPYVLRTLGELWTELEAARALTDEAAHALERAWQRGDDLTLEQRGETAIAIALAKAQSTRSGLDTATRIFDVMGARATTAKARLDRFWRNLRVHTLHDPVDYKLRDIGIWALLDTPPTPSFYS
ncbi:MAG: putative dibenzothiophene desulfurization enzyme [Pseudomonadota bacterium]